MTKTNTGTVILLTADGLFIASMFFLMPFIAEAGEATSRLGGGNAPLRATTGIAHANIANDLSARLFSTIMPRTVFPRRLPLAIDSCSSL